jgi:hypothetical protein
MRPKVPRTVEALGPQAAGWVRQDQREQGEMIGWAAFFVDSGGSRIRIVQVQLEV